MEMTHCRVFGEVWAGLFCRISRAIKRFPAWLYNIPCSLKINLHCFYPSQNKTNRLGDTKMLHTNTHTHRLELSTKTRHTDQAQYIYNKSRRDNCTTDKVPRNGNVDQCILNYFENTNILIHIQQHISHYLQMRYWWLSTGLLIHLKVILAAIKHRAQICTSTQR